MLTILPVDTRDKAAAHRFLRLPYRLYRDNPLWVPPILVDASAQLNRDKHPFYEHSDAEFFLVHRDGQDVGRMKRTWKWPAPLWITHWHGRGRGD
jgi:hypothetical protein